MAHYLPRIVADKTLFSLSSIPIVDGSVCNASVYLSHLILSNGCVYSYRQSNVALLPIVTHVGSLGRFVKPPFTRRK